MNNWNQWSYYISSVVPPLLPSSSQTETGSSCTKLQADLPDVHVVASAKEMAMLASEQVMRPVREWGLDPMYFSHVRLLGFDLLAVRPLPHMPGRFVRRGRPVRKVEMLGVVVSTDQKERYIRFILDDGTACVPCVLWMNHSRLQVTNPKRLELELQNELTMSLMRQVKLGQLLRVQGRLTVFNNQIQITVSSLHEAITH